MDNTTRIYGIDLGTTYSCISYLDENHRAVIISGDSNRLVTPSVVYFGSKDDVDVGEVAKDYSRVEPQRTVELIKQHMGDSTWEIEQFGEVYRPEDISRYILAKLAKYAEDANLGKVTDVVITVPAYFDASQRTATQQAGELAGFKVHQLIPEPTAAAIAYGVDQKLDQTIMVYDLGGGTFDISVININEGSITVICTDGEHDLGGRLWDDRIVSHLAKSWQEEHGFEDDPLDDIETSQGLYNQAENLKRNLSSRETVPATVQHGGRRTRVELTQQKFDELTADLLERTIALTQKTLQVAKDKGQGNVSKILLVGGSTYMPQVKRELDVRFGIPTELFDPDQSVAKGAAIYASSVQIQNAYREIVSEMFPDLASGQKGVRELLKGLTDEQERQVEQEVLKNLPTGTSYAALQNGKSQTITNACSKNFGAVILIDDPDNPGSLFFGIRYLIKKNDQVPAVVEESLVTPYDDQGAVEVVIIEANGDNLSGDYPLSRAESEEADLPYELPTNARRIGTVEVPIPPNSPAGTPVNVSYSLSEDGGRLEVNLQELATGFRAEAQLIEVDALTQEEMKERMYAKAKNVL